MLQYGFLRGWLVLAMLFSFVAQARDSHPAALEIGVLPYVGLTELIEAYSPLALFLEKELGQPVRIVTARDYPDFVDKTANRAYPLVVTASHFGRLAQLDSGYVPLARPLTTFQVILLVRADAAVRTVADLRGKRIATPGILAQTPMMGRVMLSGNGLSVGHDVQFHDAGNHKNALLAVLSGEVEACFVSEGAYRHMRESDRQGLREIKLANRPASGAIPVIYAASPALSAAYRAQLGAAILRFANEVPAGKTWINALKYEGLRETTEADMASLDADVIELRRVLSRPGNSH